MKITSKRYGFGEDYVLPFHYPLNCGRVCIAHNHVTQAPYCRIHLSTGISLHACPPHCNIQSAQRRCTSARRCCPGTHPRCSWLQLSEPYPSGGPCTRTSSRSDSSRSGQGQRSPGWQHHTRWRSQPAGTHRALCEGRRGGQQWLATGRSVVIPHTARAATPAAPFAGATHSHCQSPTCVSAIPGSTQRCPAPLQAEALAVALVGTRRALRRTLVQLARRRALCPPSSQSSPDRRSGTPSPQQLLCLGRSSTAPRPCRRLRGSCTRLRRRELWWVGGWVACMACGCRTKHQLLMLPHCALSQTHGEVDLRLRG